ncbi:hypothetical protein CC86DRAFT_386945 [Ophiobolus disseminans]|uniref:Aminotransferase class I/classII large domain-containing protein n=1 Tax=Ophiobolus disseminans TaxID=1469910 RepID=A0A6A6ZII2_9PLEO|nr:hypothetical protein CC86DRAFT_386945 [Ophiobolus disseminans]
MPIFASPRSNLNKEHNELTITQSSAQASAGSFVSRTKVTNPTLASTQHELPPVLYGRQSEQAYKHGFLQHPEEWANLGQGAPEVDDSIEGCFKRPKEVDISAHGREYGPTAGIRPLREAVVKLYNEHHRKWRKSQYTWENVCIVPGGRAGLICIAAVLGNCYLGFFIPDYTAYNEMLSLFRNITAIPVPLGEADQYHMSPDKIAEEICRM